MTQLSSIEHCLTCLGSLRLAVKPTRMSDDAVKAQDRLYASALARFAPHVVKATCMEWATTKSGFPELSELVKLAHETNRLLAARETAALPAPRSRGHEEFDERVKRLGYRIADFAPVDYSLWAPFMTAHYQDRIDDADLRDAISRLMRGERPSPRDYLHPPTTDAEILETWRQNDELGEQISAEPEKFMLGRLWAEVFSRFRKKRAADRPDLLARYEAVSTKPAPAEPAAVPVQPCAVSTPAAPRPAVAFPPEAMAASARRLNQRLDGYEPAPPDYADENRWERVV